MQTLGSTALKFLTTSELAQSSKAAFSVFTPVFHQISRLSTKSDFSIDAKKFHTKVPSVI